MKHCESCGFTQGYRTGSVHDYLVITDQLNRYPQGVTVTLCDDCAAHAQRGWLALADDHELHVDRHWYVIDCAACQQEARAL